MKKLASVLFSLLIIFSLFGCGAKKITAGVGVYKCTTDGLSDFTITLKDNGEFTYTEALYSDYLGTGTFDSNGDHIILTDSGMGKDNKRTFVFIRTADSLIFYAKDSDHFSLNDIPDGTVFKNTSISG